MRSHLIAIPLVLAAAAPQAVADVNRCADAELDLAYNGTDFVELSGDTGWFPSGSPAQLRLTAQVAGHTDVSAGYTTTGCWPEGMQLGLAGRPSSGNLDVAYGAELELRARINTSILGKSINWEGQIDIPFIPDDLLIAGTAKFTPSLNTLTKASVADTTSPVTVIGTNLIGNFIPIPGISGGVNISVTGGMTTTYRAKTTMLAGTAVDAISDRVTMTAPSDGFASSLSVPVGVEGVVHYQPKLTFNARFDVVILGFRVVDWNLPLVSMNLPALDRTIQLAGDAGVLELPEMEGVSEGARMDFASGSTQSLRVKNLGSAPLELAAMALPAGIMAAPLTLAAGAEGQLSVTIIDGALDAGPLAITIATNDPDRPTVAVELGKDVGGTDDGDDGSDVDDVEAQAAGCGCSTNSGPSFSVLVLLVGLALTRRRRR